MAWSGYLSSDELSQLRSTLTAGGMSGDTGAKALLSRLPTQFSAPRLSPDQAPDLDQLLADLNQVRGLPTGEVPIRVLMETAEDILRSADTAATLDGLLSSATKAAPAVRGTVRGAGQPTAGFRGAGIAPGDDISLEVTIGGTDETIPVAFLHAGEIAARSVFKLVVARFFDGQAAVHDDGTPETGTATAWVFAPGVGITNHHVFDARDRAMGEPSATDSDFRTQAEHCRLIADYRTPDDDQSGEALGPGALIYADADLDFALFRLPPSVQDRAALAHKPRSIQKLLKRKITTRVNLLQHPGGVPMRLGFRNNFVVQGDNGVLTYLTDTKRGTSGAPVLTDGWEVAALHVGSRPVSRPDIKLLGTVIRKENFGVPLYAIKKRLEARAPEVVEQITVG